MDGGSSFRTTVPQLKINDAENGTFQNVTPIPGTVGAEVNQASEVVTWTNGYVVQSGNVGGAFLSTGVIDSSAVGGETRTLIIASSVMLSACLVLVVVLSGLLYKYKTRKVLRASSPLLLSVTLLGGSLQYIECLVAMTVSGTHPLLSCIIGQWLYMVGVTLVYGALGLKTWRVSVILLFYKSRQMHTSDKELVLRLLALLGAVTLYLVIWTFLILHDGQIVRREVDACSFRTWGQIIATLGEVGLLVWCAVMCYQARLAPTLYNDSTYIGMAVWNQLIWIVNTVISRYYLETYHNHFLKLLLLFIFTQSTTTTTICLVFIPKLSSILNRTRILEGTLTDVYGPARVHKLTLVINKTGSVRTINCSPCGPLQDIKDDSEHTETSDIRETRETDYTKDEVNALIDLVSKLKNERQYYKSQLKTLVSDLKQMKETCGLQNLPWPATPLLPETPAIFAPDAAATEAHSDTGQIQKQLSMYSHKALTKRHPLANGELKCPVLTFPDSVEKPSSSSAAVTTPSGMKSSFTTNGHFYPRSFWVANVLATPGNHTNGSDTVRIINPNEVGKRVIKPSRTGDSICTMMTSISLPSPTTDLLNVEETNLGLLETLSPSTGYKTEESTKDKIPTVPCPDQGGTSGGFYGIGGLNSPDSSIAQGYDNKGICEWLSQNESTSVPNKTAGACVTSGLNGASWGKDNCPVQGIVSSSSSNNKCSTSITLSNTQPIVNSTCVTSSDPNQTTHPGDKPTNNLSNPPSGDRATTGCCGVRQKCPVVNNALSLTTNYKNIASGPQRPNSLTLVKQPCDHSVGCYTKKTNFVFYI